MYHSGMSRQPEPSKEDVGAAMMAWYADAIRQYPEGLVTQAQAAKMLGISRVAVGRLVGRGYLRTVYFPNPPDVLGIVVAPDDPFILKILGMLGPKDTYAYPKATYVSFADVMDLWQSGEARKKCARNWSSVMAVIDWPTKAGEKRVNERLRKILDEFREQAESERALKKLHSEMYGGREDGSRGSKISRG